MSDLVRLTVDGVGFDGWEAVTITRTLDSVADAFSLAAPYRTDRPRVKNAFRPFAYQEARLFLDDNLLLTGYLESLDYSVTSADQTVNAQGRSKTGVLVDCMLEPKSYKKLTLAAIARDVCAPFGITVTATDDTSAITQAVTEPNQTAYDFLQGLANSYGKILTCDSLGGLVISKPGKTRTVENIEQGRGGLLAISASYDGTQRYSEYKIQQQRSGKNITATAKDPLPIHRPWSGGSEADGKSAQDSANWTRGLALAGAISVNATVTGWRRNDGTVWAPGDTVSVTAPGVRIDTPTAFVIAEVSLKLDSGGRLADLRLVLPSTYTGELPEVEPWK